MAALPSHSTTCCPKLWGGSVPCWPLHSEMLLGPAAAEDLQRQGALRLSHSVAVWAGATRLFPQEGCELLMCRGLSHPLGTRGISSICSLLGPKDTHLRWALKLGMECTQHTD